MSVVWFLLTGALAMVATEEAWLVKENSGQGDERGPAALSRRAFGAAALGAAGALLIDNDAQAATTLYLPIPEFRVIERAALISYGQLKVNDRAQVLTLRGGYASLLNLGTGETNLGVDARTGTVLSRGAVRLRDRARVEGLVQSTGSVTLDTPAQNYIASGKLANLSFDIGRKNWPVSFPTPGNHLTAASGAALTPAPGSYGNVTANSGSSITLKSGRYFMTSLSLQSGSELKLDKRSGPIEVYVSNTFVHRARLVDLGGEAADFLVAVFGSTEVSVEQPFAGSLFVPNAKLTLATVAGSYLGQFLGKNVEVHQNNRVYARPVDWRKISTPAACGSVPTLGGAP